MIRLLLISAILTAVLLYPTIITSNFTKINPNPEPEPDSDDSDDSSGSGSQSHSGSGSQTPSDP